MIFGTLSAGSPPSDLWHDPIFLAGAGILATLLGAIIGLIPYLLSLYQNRRRFVYSINSDVPVLRKEVGDQMKVVFNGKEVLEPRLLVVDLWNEGGVPLDPNDFKEPIAFSFAGQTEILDVGVLESRPSNMGAVLKVAQSDVLLQPLLFNKGDRLRIRMLVSGLTGKLRVLSRIKGMSGILDYRQVKKGRSVLAWSSFALFFVISTVTLVASFSIVHIPAACKAAMEANSANVSTTANVLSTIFIISAILVLVSFYYVMIVRAQERRSRSR